jgi:hypothetical protein
MLTLYISNKMQRYTVYLYLETALHVSDGTSTHHQLAAVSSNGLSNTRCCRYSCMLS